MICYNLALSLFRIRLLVITPSSKGFFSSPLGIHKVIPSPILQRIVVITPMMYLLGFRQFLSVNFLISSLIFYVSQLFGDSCSIYTICFYERKVVQIPAVWLFLIVKLLLVPVVPSVTFATKLKWPSGLPTHFYRSVFFVLNATHGF